MCINAENTFYQKHKYRYLGIHWKLRFTHSFLQKVTGHMISVESKSMLLISSGIKVILLPSTLNQPLPLTEQGFP